VSEQVLPILKAYSGSTQTTAKSMLEIVNPDLFEARPLSRPDPSGIQHPRNGMAIVREDEDRVFPPTRLDHRIRYPVQHHQSIFAVLNATTWNDEDAGIKLGDLYFVVPPKTAYFSIPTSSVDPEQSHLFQMIWKFLKEPRLFLPAKRVGLSLSIVR
jgi:hypothetical protein